MTRLLSSALYDSVRNADAPGAVACVGQRGKILFLDAVGYRQIEPSRLPASIDTIYDLASLTKVVATTTAVMLLQQKDKLDLDKPVSEYLPIPAFGRFTLRHCLTHTSGLVAGGQYYREAATIDEMLMKYAALPLEYDPGKARVYSDIGFMILGRIVELVAREPLDSFCAKNIFKPLGMAKTMFRPPPEMAKSCAATERCQWRNKLICGEVHDEHAYAVGGVSGHAGLFSTAGDLGLFCQAIVDNRLLAKEALGGMTRLGQVPFYPWQGLGWKRDPWSSATEGFLPSRDAIGHTGWTGTSIWIDLESGLYAILLSNTCHPSRDKRKNEVLRHVFYGTVAKEFFPSKANVHSGLDRVLRNEFDGLHGKKVALLTNHAAVDQLERHILDVLGFDPATRLELIFSPEHGLKGQFEAGEPVVSESGDVRIISLYGARKAPTREELAGIDLFVVDLPDIGVRYYTYMATMLDCMRACAEAGVPVLVLDRPNPLGGDILEGPIATQTGSPTCCAPIPVRHGMTLGELAFFFRDTLLKGQKLDLSVNLLDNWRPSLLFKQCELPWVRPSPNIPTAETALVYVGTCLFEGTNLNEGRGTDMPFHVIGAPWLRADEVIRSIGRDLCSGCRLSSITYTPRSIPHVASNPRYRDETCAGILIEAHDPIEFRPFTLAIGLLSAIRRRHSEEFRWEKSFDTLAGGPDLRLAIEKEETPSHIVGRYDRALRKFNKTRPRLYAEEGREPRR